MLLLARSLLYGRVTAGFGVRESGGFVSIKDKLELGLKPDAPFRADNLPEFQKFDPDCQIAGEPGESARQRRARDRCAMPLSVARAVRAQRQAAPARRPRRARVGD
jgi:hypothetical protein